MAGHPDGERYLDYTSGIGVTNTGHAHPRVAAAIQAQAAKLLHGQQNIVYHEPGLRLYERLPARAARRAVAGVPVELGRRGGRGGGQARAGRDRPAGDHRVPLRVPRPDGPDDGADGGQGRLPRRLRAAAGVASTTRPTRTAIGPPGGAARPVGLHVRLGGPARPAVPPARLPRQGRRDHRRAGPRRGRLHRPAARRSCRGSARSPASTGSCSSPTRSRRASGGPARCSRSSTGTSSPTSWSWPRASRRGCRCPGSSRAPS